MKKLYFKEVGRGQPHKLVALNVEKPYKLQSKKYIFIASIDLSHGIDIWSTGMAVAYIIHDYRK